jgi:hypothetical protein
MTDVQRLILQCLFTRHHDGLVRQLYLERIIRSRDPWVFPFVTQLIGEYVIEILEIIHQNLNKLDTLGYREFLVGNPQFLQITNHRVLSYWDCYYRDTGRNEYVGFKLTNFLNGLVHGSKPAFS